MIFSFSTKAIPVAPQKSYVVKHTAKSYVSVNFFSIFNIRFKISNGSNVPLFLNVFRWRETFFVLLVLIISIEALIEMEFYEEER